MLSKQGHYKNYTFWYKEIENYEKAVKPLDFGGQKRRS